MENEELDNIIELNDEDGNVVKFEFLDLVELDGEEYVVLLPVVGEGEEGDGEVVILRLESTDEEAGEESYVGVEDEQILNGKISQVIDIAIKECERMYPVFKVVLTKGMDPKQALYPMLMETLGQA